MHEPFEAAGGQHNIKFLLLLVKISRPCLDQSKNSNHVFFPATLYFLSAQFTFQSVNHIKILMTQFDCSQCLFSWLFEMTKNLSQVFVFQRVYYVQGFHQVWYQGGMKATVSGVVEDLKFKISEGSDPNWCFPDSAQLAVSV